MTSPRAWAWAPLDGTQPPGSRSDESWRLGARDCEFDPELSATCSDQQYPEVETQLERNTPLWFYVLKEAEVESVRASTSGPSEAASSPRSLIGLPA